MGKWWFGCLYVRFIFYCLFDCLLGLCLLVGLFLWLVGFALPFAVLVAVCCLGLACAAVGGVLAWLFIS